MADRFLISGATGLIGGRLTRALLEGHSEVRALCREPERARGKFRSGVETVGWNGVHVAPDLRLREDSSED